MIWLAPHAGGCRMNWSLASDCVCMGYANPQAGLWTLVDGELFLPEAIFAKAKQRLRRQQGIPAQRTFATKVALGWQMIRRAQANGLPCEVIACDTLYGRKAEF